MFEDVLSIVTIQNRLRRVRNRRIGKMGWKRKMNNQQRVKTILKTATDMYLDSSFYKFFRKNYLSNIRLRSK